MSSEAITLTVNGAPVTTRVAPRTHLADLLREELLLTGTHLGCEQGVCGACTLFMDGRPVRACLTLAVACDGASITTIEGFADDQLMAQLRAAFSRHHALQCGYCTPGMLVTAYDICRRLPEADVARIRAELAGNLCRCTGYQGIVAAIAAVLAEGHRPPAVLSGPVRGVRRVPQAGLPASRGRATAGEASGGGGGGEPAPETSLGDAGVETSRPAHPEADGAGAASDAVSVPTPPPGFDGLADAFTLAGAQRLSRRLPLAVPPAALWSLLADPAAVAACVPGARLTVPPDPVTGGFAGEVAVALGPLGARFTGTGAVRYREAGQAGALRGQGADRVTGTRLVGALAFELGTRPDGQGAILALDLAWRLEGPLAQFARPTVVVALTDRLLQELGQALEARARGVSAPPPARLDGLALVLGALKALLRRLIRRH